MILREAYQTLEIPETATPEEAKKQFKKLASKYHPDVNKEPDAEAKFKKINEAYQLIESGEAQPAMRGWGPFNGGFTNINFPFSHFAQTQKQHLASNIDLQTIISFKEAVQGCEREITYVRRLKCPYCQGNGNKPINNGCKTCGGKGQINNRQNGAIFIQTCPQCRGRAQTAPCTDCDNKGTVETTTSVRVPVPAFWVEGHTLRCQGMGNFAGSLMGIHDQYTDVLLHIKVTSEPGLRLEGQDIISELNISLLDALRGCVRDVTTIDGKKEVNINSCIKNKDEITMLVGDHANIKHRVIVKIDYPDDINQIIDVLTEEGKIK